MYLEELLNYLSLLQVNKYTFIEMTHKLVRFVEDRLFHICEEKDLKIKIPNVLAKYKGFFYPAVIYDEGCKY